ncbi:flagellar biosynthetic protein FliR [Brevibacillus ginsengisoli]|uniref:flagellar biosynthetic protein FliR n=1 Tax=Brevibacillus ginsengisoli TaxID=363854 RepID=UPI003CE9B160
MEALITYLPYFLLVFVRLTSFFVSAPIFSMRGVPNHFKIGLAFVVALVSSFYVPFQDKIPMDLSFILYAVKEVLIGLLLGLITQMLFYAVQIAGGLIDMQAGFAMANVIDPRTGAYVPLTGNFNNILATFYFLSIDGHHMLIRGVIASYKAIPIDRMWAPFGSENLFMYIVKVFSEMFTSAFLIAAPVVVALFLVDLSLGIIAKTVPQFNIFVVGMPIKVFATFLMLIVVLPALFMVLNGLFQNMFSAMSKIIVLLGG